MFLQETKQKPQVTIERQQLRSKLLSINKYIDALLQKKIRLDLEIRKQKKVLSKLRNQSSLKMKASLKLEDSIQPIFLKPIDHPFDQLKARFVDDPEMLELLEETDHRLREIEGLEQFLYSD